MLGGGGWVASLITSMASIDCLVAVVPQPLPVF